MSKKLHWRYAYEREIHNLSKLKPNILRNKNPIEMMTEEERRQDDEMWERHRLWEAKYNQVKWEYHQRCQCTCKVFHVLATWFSIHALTCPVNDQTEGKVGFWRNRIQICRDQRDKIENRLYDEMRGIIPVTSGQWDDMVMCSCDIKELHPAWLKAQRELYHLPSSIALAEQKLRLLRLRCRRAKLDRKIAELSAFGCTCRCLLGLHSPWCPARGKKGMPLK